MSGISSAIEKVYPKNDRRVDAARTAIGIGVALFAKYAFKVSLVQVGGGLLIADRLFAQRTRLQRVEERVDHLIKNENENEKEEDDTELKATPTGDTAGEGSIDFNSGSDADAGSGTEG